MSWLATQLCNWFVSSLICQTFLPQFNLLCACAINSEHVKQVTPFRTQFWFCIAREKRGSRALFTRATPYLYTALPFFFFKLLPLLFVRAPSPPAPSSSPNERANLSYALSGVFVVAAVGESLSVFHYSSCAGRRAQRIMRLEAVRIG